MTATRVRDVELSPWTTAALYRLDRTTSDGPAHARWATVFDHLIVSTLNGGAWAGETIVLPATAHGTAIDVGQALTTINAPDHAAALNAAGYRLA